MSELDLSRHPHRRYNPLTGEWLLVSPHRGRRPWQGQTEAPPPDGRPAYDPGCYLCPGNERAGGVKNPGYPGTFVFDNDFAALLNDTPGGAINTDDSGLLRAVAERGVCRVICFSPRHDITLAEMTTAEIRRVVDLWANQYRGLGLEPHIKHVQIFENKGAAMGCSNPHPHGQIWAQSSIPNEPAKVLYHLQRHHAERGSPLLNDYLAVELARGERVVCENDAFVALVPFWAVWPFETLLLPRRPAASLAELDEAERDLFADMVRRVAVRYDNLFQTSFPYSAGLHQAPTDGEPHPEYSLHMHFYPPLLRSAAVKKFMVGYEMFAEPQRDVTPEVGAERLRGLAETHYKASGR